MPAPPGTMVHTIIERILQFFQEPKNREKIQSQCIDPFIRHVLDRLFPYIILTCIIFSLILLMSLASVALLILQLRSVPAVVSTAALGIPEIIQPLV